MMPLPHDSSFWAFIALGVILILGGAGLIALNIALYSGKL